MKKGTLFHKCIACTMVTALLAQPFSYPVFAETTSEKIKKAEELKKQTEAQKEQVEQKRDALEDEKDQLQVYLSQLNADLEEISENLEDLEKQVSEKEAQIEGTLADLENARSEERNQYALMKKRVKYIYEKGESSLLEAFLTASSYSDFLNKAEYVSKVEEYDQRMFENLVAMRRDIEDREAKLEAERKELITLQEQAETEQNKVNDMVNSTSGSLAATNGAISAAALEEAAYEAELKAQEANLAALKKQLAEEQAMSARAAKMAWRDISEITFEEGDRELLACLIYCEAGAEPYEGQVAVGAVVINRMRSAAYPNTMVGVIYQNRQFSPVASGRLATRLALGANSSCYSAADEAMKGSTPVGNCLYFRTVIPEINGQIIGGHVFY
ncbi:MAG: cell wall hydrolase [Lachnospiraceae bacterium]|nr:cell wall hydrolase [Lachnospiraceae bacterium]